MPDAIPKCTLYSLFKFSFLILPSEKIAIGISFIFFLPFLSFLEFVCFLMFACLFISHRSKHTWFIYYNVWIITSPLQEIRKNYVSALGIRDWWNMGWCCNNYCWWSGNCIIQRSPKYLQS